MYYQVAVIQSLKNNSRGLSYTDLRHNVDEILSTYDMKISKDGFTKTLKTLIDSEVLTKKQILKKETGRPMIYTITKGNYAQKQVELIIEVGKAPKLIDYIAEILEGCERASVNIQNSNVKGKKNHINELNENLILLAKITPPMIAKMILYQFKSIENPYLLKEIQRLEREARKLFNRAGVLSKKLGKENHDEFITEFDSTFTKELSTSYNKFLKKNTIFPKD